MKTAAGDRLVVQGLLVNVDLFFELNLRYGDKGLGREGSSLHLNPERSVACCGLGERPAGHSFPARKTKT